MSRVSNTGSGEVRTESHGLTFRKTHPCKSCRAFERGFTVVRHGNQFSFPLWVPLMAFGLLF